jgi:hypothetical protein
VKGRHVVVHAVLMLLALGSGRASADTVRPRIACDGRTRCVVSRLPKVVTDRDVRGYLESGLTTSLVLTLSGQGTAGARRQSVARIDVRFEPWDETFELWVATEGQALRKESIVRARLSNWWEELHLPFPLTDVTTGNARVDVDLIPFSEEEEADTRRWYAEALRGGSANTESRGAAVPMLDALTLTSIKRHGVLRFSWSSPVGAAP